jgi:ketosteroid isomerase-like protein
MDVTRRDLAIAGTLALGAASLMTAGGAHADVSGVAAVKDQVEALRKALFGADKTRLAELTAAELSYGHSSGKVQNKDEFIDGVLNRKAVVKSLTFPDLTVSLAGDVAIVRHTYASQSETDGKADNVKIGVLAVWQKQNGGWKLLARQGYKPT